MTELPDEFQIGKAEQSGKHRFRVRFRLWFLFLLFIPAAFDGRNLGRNYRLEYTESKANFMQFEGQEIAFDKLPSGAPTGKRQNVNDTYQSMGVSFSFGTPDELDQKKRVGQEPEAQAQIHRDSSVGTKDSKSPLVDSLPAVRSPADNSASTPTMGSVVRSKRNQLISSSGNSRTGFVGISGFAFRFPSAHYSCSIAPFENIGTIAPYRMVKRFKGPITIRFHQPNNPNEITGTNHVGFLVARLNVSETLEVCLYSPDGKFIARQTNIGDTCVFMGLSCKHEIGWVEIDAIGSDKDYAITGLVFDKIE